jgi:hypothetical protein
VFPGAPSTKTPALPVKLGSSPAQPFTPNQLPVMRLPLAFGP